jgi:2-aminomuconate deaminase
MTDMDKIHSDDAPEPVGSYPHARRVGNLIFLSGVGPRKKGTKQIPGVTLDAEGKIVSYDIEQWDNLVDVTVFLTNMKEDFPVFNKIYSEYFQHNQPCRTTVEVNALPTPIAIELKCIATV